MAAAMGGGGFVVVDHANQGFTAEATAAIVGQIRAQIIEGQDYLNTLPEILSGVRTLKVQVEALALEQATLTEQLNGRIPETAKAQTSAEASLAELARRDAEVSDKLKTSFAAIEARLSEVGVKASAVDGMQSSTHTIVAKQEQDLIDAKAEIEKVVLGAVAHVERLAQQQQGCSGPQEQGAFGGDRDGPKFNDARKSEVAELTDTISKAAFVSWRDNLDLHLEEFSDFGLGTNEFL